MSKRFLASLFIFLLAYFYAGNDPVLLATPAIDRIAGQTSFQTTEAIAERYNSTNCQNIVITTGKGFADALSASVLANKLDAPILLADQTAVRYAHEYLAKEGTVWLIGGTKAIGDQFAGNFSNVKRIEGRDQYETSALIARQLGKTDTAVICSGQNFADALSISSIAAHNNWPILLVGKNYLPPQIQDYIRDNQPKTIYIVGGHSVVSYKVEDQIRQMLPSARLERFQGYNRFETSASVLARFVPNPQNLYFASGNGFADALTGSVLAAKTGGALVLCDSNYLDLPPAIDQYIASLPTLPVIHVLGGQSAVSDETVLHAGQQVQPAAKNTDFVNLAEYIPPLLIDLPYAGTDNLTHTKLYDKNAAYLRKGTADKLKSAVEELSQAGYHVKIWDAYRPPAVQFKLWSIVSDPNYVANPWTGYSDHSRGSAVDLTIDNLSMPTGFDDFTDRAFRSNQNDNAKLLESVMVKHGFVPLATEWWHFTDSDEYDPVENIHLAPRASQRPNGKENITISVIGDVILGQDNRFGNLDKYYKRYGPDYFFAGVKNILIKDTLTIANFEGTLTNRTQLVDKSHQGDRAFWFRGDPAYTAILQKGSVEAVNLANNHSMDYFQAGFDDTVSLLKKAGIACFGEDQTAVAGKVGLIGANVLGPVEQGVDPAALKNTLKAQIKTLKQQVPIVIVYFHWGKENDTTVDQIQKDLARFAVDQGADLVVGSHPHVLQPAEQYKGKTIVYSLGNFVFGGNTRLPYRDTAIFQQTFRLVNGRLAAIEEGKLIPCSASGSDGKNDYRPVLK